LIVPAVKICRQQWCNTYQDSQVQVRVPSTHHW